MIKKLCDTCEQPVPNFPAYRVEKLGVGVPLVSDFCSARCLRVFAEKIEAEL